MDTRLRSTGGRLLALLLAQLVLAARVINLMLVEATLAAQILTSTRGRQSIRPRMPPKFELAAKGTAGEKRPLSS